MTLANDIKLDVLCISRENNKLADKYSKIIDFGDWFVTPKLFDTFSSEGWGIATIDRSVKQSENNKIQFKTYLSGRYKE